MIAITDRGLAQLDRVEVGDLDIGPGTKVFDDFSVLAVLADQGPANDFDDLVSLSFSRGREDSPNTQQLREASRRLFVTGHIETSRIPAPRFVTDGPQRSQESFFEAQTSKADSGPSLN